MRLGVLGGTFNPIHYGHLRAAEEAGENLSLDRVLFMPAGNPPLKSSDLADAPKRFAMVKAAVEDNPRFEPSDIELGGGTSYTVDTIGRLRDLYSGDRLFFILGIDAFLELSRWKDPERLVRGTDFVILKRPGHSFADLSASPFLEIPEPELGRLERGEVGSLTIPLRGGREATLLNTTPLGISASMIRTLFRQGRSIKYLLPESVEFLIMTDGLFAE
jgi:nicotinate-nucleotide adenylyltransferase